MRLIFATACVLALCSPATAGGKKEPKITNSTQPLGGKGSLARGVELVIDASPGKSRPVYEGQRSAHFGTPAEARRSCVGAGGEFAERAGSLVCRNPRSLLRAADGDIIVTGTRIPQPSL
jgi:hypothetical protein